MLAKMLHCAVSVCNQINGHLPICLLVMLRLLKTACVVVEKDAFLPVGNGRTGFG